MFVTRLISGIVLIAIAAVTIIIGGGVWFAVVAALSFIGLFELYRIMKLEKSLLGMAGYFLTAIYLTVTYLWIEEGQPMVIVLSVMVFFAIYVFTFPRYKLDQISFALMGILYVPVLMTHMYQIRRMSDGLYLLPLVFVSAWGNDTCAYCVGMLIGKHKMSPKLSPKKSVEGFFGGIIGAVLLGMLYGRLLGEQIPSLYYPTAFCGILCGGGALIAVVGDLAASAIKRDTGIKDYGKLIPGHGGVLDRFDSVLFTAPMVYFLAVCLGAV